MEVKECPYSLAKQLNYQDSSYQRDYNHYYSSSVINTSVQSGVDLIISESASQSHAEASGRALRNFTAIGFAKLD